MSMELPVFARDMPKVERAFGELAVGLLVAVYFESSAAEDTELLPVTCGRVVGVPQKGDELSSACRYLSIAPLDDDGGPAPHNYGAGVKVTKVFLPPTPKSPFRFFELRPAPERD